MSKKYKYQNGFYYLHQLTFPEVLTSKFPVGSIEGELVGGPDRRFENPTTQFLAWQEEVATMCRSEDFVDVPQRVIDYFQATKHLNSAPKEEPKAIIEVECHRTIRKDPAAPPRKKNARFSWSYSALNDYENCPLECAEKRWYKSVVEEESAHIIWGNRVHGTAQNVLEGKAGDVEVLPLVLPYANAIKKQAAGGILLVEQQLAVDRKLKPCGFKDWDRAWGRAVLDVAVLLGSKACIIDWKTGALKHDETQLRLFAAFLAIHHPEIQEFDAKFIWLKDGKITGLKQPLTRKDLIGTWKEMLGRVKRMEDAWESEIFSARTSGLCKNYCPVVTCPHNGKNGKK